MGINLEDYVMENYYHTHHVNHSERTCPELINYFTTILVPSDPPKKENKNDKEEDDEYQREEEEDEGEENPPSHINLIWCEVEIGDDDHDDIMEEACVGHDYNVCNKGTPKSNDSPATIKTNTNNNTTTTSTYKQTSVYKSPEKEKDKEKEKEKEKEK